MPANKEAIHITLFFILLNLQFLYNVFSQAFAKATAYAVPPTLRPLSLLPISDSRLPTSAYRVGRSFSEGLLAYKRRDIRTGIPFFGIGYI